MQSATEAAATLVNDNGLVPATQLREMTISQEELAKRQKASVLESLMNSMVRVASEAGGRTYAANLNPQFDSTLLAEIVSELETLGYNVANEAKSQEGIGPFIQLTINW